jgi:hypothetical protein
VLSAGTTVDVGHGTNPLTRESAARRMEPVATGAVTG